MNLGRPRGRAPRSDAPCARARGVRLRPADGRRRGHRRPPHAHATSNRYAHPHANPNSDCNPDSNRDAHTNVYANTDPFSYTYAHPYADANRHADANPSAVPVDRVPAGLVARRRTDRPRRVRGDSTIGDVRVGAAQQARRRCRGRTVRGLYDRSPHRRHPPDRRRFPRIRGLRLVDAEAASNTDANAYPYADSDAIPRSCELPGSRAVHHAE